MTKYSDKEISLIKRMGYANIADKVMPVTIYRMMAEDCFIHKKTGEDVESIRRILRVLINGDKIYRLTEEFDNLIH